jgi:hypothetical protein
MGEKGLMRAQEFSWDVVARRVADYYKQLLNGRGPASSAAALSAEERAREARGKGL